MMEPEKVVDTMLDISLDADGLLSSSSSNVNGNAGAGDPSSFGEVILQDMDSYWEDLSGCLIVSRMVNDIVIKGMVNDMVEEAANRITSKEAELAVLHQKLHSYELDIVKAKKSGSLVMQKYLEESKSELQPSCVDLFVEQNHSEHLKCLKNVAEEQLQRLKNEIEDAKSFTFVRKTDLGSQKAQFLNKDSMPMNLLKMEETLDGLTEALGSIYEEIGGITCLFNNSLRDQQWVWDFQKEVDHIIVQNHLKGLLEESHKRLDEEKHIYNNNKRNCSKRLDKLTSLRNELDAINKSLLNPEAGHLLTCHIIHENIEERNSTDRMETFSPEALGNHLLSFSSHSRENGAGMTVKSRSSMSEFGECPLLSHMTNEELVSHFNSEIAKLKRNHESAVHQMTDELFAAKRELLKRKGSALSKKEREYREYENLRKKIPEFIRKLDDLIGENEALHMGQDDYRKFCNLEDAILKLSHENDDLNNENRHLRDVLANRKKEIKCLSAQVSHAATQMSNHSSVEAKFMKQIKKLRRSIEDVKLEENLSDEILSIIMREALCEIKCLMQISGMEVELEYDIYSILLQGFVRDMRSAVNALILKHNKEKSLLEAVIVQKDETLCLEIEKMKKLKHDTETLSQLVDEKGKLAQEREAQLIQLKEQLVRVYEELCMSKEKKEKYEQEAGFKLMQQKEQYEIVCQDLNILKEKAYKQEILISQYRKESDLLDHKLQGANDQVHIYKEELSKLRETLNEALHKLEEAESQINTLHENVEKNHKSLEKLASEKRQLEEVMKSLVFSVLNMSKAFKDMESHVVGNIQRNNLRLEKLKYEHGSIKQLAENLCREISHCKKNIETKTSNLQKAEIEVDLLGDEVDALLGILVKVYIALDHYSSVLQHYPGVVEILKLVRRELEGTAKQLPL